MAVRCIRCGNYVDGVAQLCDSCAAEKKAAEAAGREAAVKATTNICPSCGQEIPRASESCPNCMRSFAQPGAQLVPYSKADFFVRFAAYLIDSFGFGFIGGVLISIAGLDLAAGITIVSLGYLVAQFVFLLAFGATPGKMLMGIKVVALDGRPVGVGHCLMRTFGYFVCNITGGILYLLIAIKEDKRGVEDMMSGTMVVYRDSIPKTTAAGAASAS